MEHVPYRAAPRWICAATRRCACPLSDIRPMAWRTRDPARRCAHGARRTLAIRARSEEARSGIVGPQPRLARDTQAIPLAHDPTALHEAIHLTRALVRPWIDAEVARARGQIDPARQAQAQHDPLAK